MWAGTAAFLLRYPSYRGSGLGQVDPDQFHYYITKVRNLNPLDFLVAGRVMLVLGQTLILGMAFLFATQLTGLYPALIGCLLIAFDPFHAGLTRLLHLDGLYSNLALLSVLALLAFLKNRGALALSISAVAAGLAWLTKSPAFLLAPITGVLFALWELPGWRPGVWGVSSGAINKRLPPAVWKAISPIILWGMLAGLCFFILWPAMWVDPLEVVNNVLFKAQNYAEEGHHASVFFNGRSYTGQDTGLGLLIFYLLSFLWRATPILLLGLLLAVAGWIKSEPPFDQPGVRQMSGGLLVFVAIFVLGFSLASKKFDRYILPIFAPLDLLASLGWVWAAGKLANLRLGRSAQTLFAATCALPVVLQFAAIASSYPYYISYYNPWMGGPLKAQQVMQIGWGEGIEAAAAYLNQHPHTEDLHVSAWYSAGSFSYFFKGHVRPLGYQSEMNEKEWERFISSDYAVIYIHQWQRQIPKPVLDYVAWLEPEHTVWLDGLEYVRIYKLP
jgi:hypothetical protein